MNKVALFYSAFSFVMVQSSIVLAYHEHKVHNIVLYPDKHSWCKTTTIKQVISYPGCTSIEIDNNVCVGACFSYSIPHTEPSDPGEVIVPYCDSCQPSETTWHQVTLQCSKNDVDTPWQLIKNVQIIQNCLCTPCEKGSLRMSKVPKNTDDSLLQPKVDAEFLNALQKRNGSSYNHIDNAHWKKMHSFLSQKLVGLLKNIEANNTEHDKEQLLDLMDIIRQPVKNKLRIKDIVDLIESLENTNDTKFDSEKLAELLYKYESSRHTKSDKDIKSDSPNDVKLLETDTDGDMDGEETLSLESASLNEPVVGRIQNSYEGREHPHDREYVNDHDYEDEDDHPNDHRIPSDNSDENNFLDTRHMSPQNGDTSRHHTHGHPPHLHQHPHPHPHHVNENVAGHGHLAHGPHGALIIEPDRIHEKLDVNAHELKPNHAGTLLSYRSHGGENVAHD